MFFEKMAARQKVSFSLGKIHFRESGNFKSPVEKSSFSLRKIPFGDSRVVMFLRCVLSDSSYFLRKSTLFGVSRGGAGGAFLASCGVFGVDVGLKKCVFRYEKYLLITR